MKRKIYYIVLICLLIFMSACSKQQKNTQAEDNFDMNIAKQVATAYMDNIMDGNVKLNYKLFSKNMNKDIINKVNSNLIINGYNIDEVNEIGKAMQMNVKISRSDKTKTYSCLDTFQIKVIKEDSKYKISEVIDMLEKEAFPDGTNVRYKDKDNAKTSLLIRTESLPMFYYSRYDKAYNNKISVPKNKVDMVSFNYSGDKILISTYDKNSYIALVEIDETLQTQGDSTSEGQGGNAELNPREKPIGKAIKSIDIIPNSRVKMMSFSQEENFVTVQYEYGNKQESINIYDTDNGEMIPFDFSKQYSLKFLNIKYLNYDKDAVYYEVTAKKGVDLSSKEVRYSIGKWKLDLKKFQAEKAH